jgi:outer membrane lipoprotein-sorting protein
MRRFAVSCWPSVRFFLSMSCTASVLSACTTVPRPEFRSEASPEQALIAVRNRALGRRTLRATGRVTYFGAKGRVRLKVVVVAARPASFRVETLSMFEEPLEVMTCNGTSLYHLAKGRIQEGPATPENVAKLLPVPVGPEAMVDAFLGGAPGQGALNRARDLEDDPDVWVIESAGNPARRLRYDHRSQHILGMTVLPEGPRREIEVFFSDFENDAVGPFPRSIQIRVPGKQLDLSIQLRDVETNVALDPGLFRLGTSTSTSQAVSDGVGLTGQ